jgi:hypothetical protein
MYKILIYEKIIIYMHPRFCMHEHFDLITNPFNYKCETSQVFIYTFKTIMLSAKFNSWIVDLTTFIVNDSIHVQMLIVQKMQKKITNPFNYKYETLNCYVCFHIY